jgi:uncharacterized linocin/CFP29 family protein
MSANSGGGLVVDSGRTFFSGSSGKWAGERFLAALKAGRAISPAELRTLDTLRKDEWKVFDDALIASAVARLRGVADLINAGLTRTIPNGLAKTILEYEKVSDLDPAIVSMDGVTRSENDRLEFTLAGLPLPITHKDWYLNLRHLMASREKGEALDTMHSRIAGRKVAEESERMLFEGGKTFQGLPIYGYTTHPQRMTVAFGTGGSWDQAAKTGEQMLTDVLTVLGMMDAEQQFGPYVLYIPADAAVNLSKDFKSNSDKSIRQRLSEIEGLSAIRVVDQLATGNLLLVQMTPETVQWIIGENLQTIQWDIHGGFQINFKAFQIGVTLIRSDYDERVGIVHMS